MRWNHGKSTNWVNSNGIVVEVSALSVAHPLVAKHCAILFCTPFVKGGQIGAALHTHFPFIQARKYEKWIIYPSLPYNKVLPNLYHSTAVQKLYNVPCEQFYQSHQW